MRLVVERERLCATLDTQDTSGISRIGLKKLGVSVQKFGHGVGGETDDIDLVVSEKTNAGCAARNLLFIFGICS